MHNNLAMSRLDGIKYIIVTGGGFSHYLVFDRGTHSQWGFLSQMSVTKWQQTFRLLTDLLDF